MTYKFIRLNPSQTLSILFFIFISLGTVMLKIPAATTEAISWLDALFTATSAMTVTGLTVVDTGSVYTLFGQIVILLLIQVGGLGIMSFAALITIALGKKIGLSEKILIQSALNQTSIGGITKLVKNIFIYSFVIEFLAMLFLSLKWVPEYGLFKGLYYSLFHAVSAFNNAGFSIWTDNLMGYTSDPLINTVIAGLFIVGGIGFTVLADMWSTRGFKKLSLHSKLMIVGTLALNFVAMIVIFALEYHNVDTLGSLSSLTDQLTAAFFQGTSPRTAGFNTLDIGSLEDPTITFMLLLMFIGAGSASTGGGIKLTTFIVIILAVLMFLKQKDQITIGHRAIKDLAIIKALAILSISMLFIFSALFILTVTEAQPFISLLFEVVSAFGTVGLSLGITPSLSGIGKVIIIITMFIGKLGPLTLALSLARRVSSKTRYPNEDVLIG